MKNIIIVTLSIITVLSIAFGIYQKNQAVAFRIKALENEVLAKQMSLEAEKLTKLAEHQRIMAEYNAMEARRQQMIAIENERKK